MNLLRKRIYQIVLFVLYIGLLVFFSYESLKDGSSSSDSSSRISLIISSIIEFFTGKDFIITDSFDYLVRKLIGHFSYFCLLGIISSLFYYSFVNNLKKLNYFSIVHFSTGFVFAFITEYLFQQIAIGRNPSMKDVIIDFSGFIFISSFIFLVLYFNFLRKFLKKSDKKHFFCI